MFISNSFRKKLMAILEGPNHISKEDLYDNYLEMTERYLTEMISLLNFEKVIIQELGESRGEMLIEKIATSNTAITSLDEINGRELEQTERIRNLLGFIETELR